MKKLLLYILTNIVENPDQIAVKQSSDDTGLITLNVIVAQEDMGKVIGKGGKVINAIRQIIKILAIKQGKRINISLNEPSQESEDTSEK